jgi:hypothetical protein
VQPGQGRGKGAASPAHRGSAVGNRWPCGVCELAGAGYRAWQITGSRPSRWLVGARGGRALARLAGAGIVGQVTGGRCPSSGQYRGGERRERGRKKGWDSN